MTERLERYRLNIRRHELNAVLKFFPPSSRVLELGGGAGFHAQQLHRIGCRVRSLDVDVPDEEESKRLFPVELYDGHHIPAADTSIDVVFSAHVMEHVEAFMSLQSEIRRVLRPEGIVIHIVPSASWRFWTVLTHYCATFGALRDHLGSQKTGKARIRRRRWSTEPQPFLWFFTRVLLPGRHGESGNTLSELFRFSHRSWTRSFRESGWAILHSEPVGVFYSGYAVLGEYLPLGLRKYLSRILGSSSHFFVLKPETLPTTADYRN